MANQVPDQRSIIIPPDSAFAAGLPVAGGSIRHIGQFERWLYEAITGGICPGESVLTLDDSEEWLRPHDHSGTVSSINHGAYAPQYGHATLNRTACDPFATWPAGWEYTQDGTDIVEPNGITPTPSIWDAKFGNNWWVLSYTKAYNPAVPAALLAAWCGMVKVRIRRGTNTLHVNQVCAQADATGTSLTAGEIHWATVDTSGALIGSDSATLARTNDETVQGYVYEQSGSLDVAASSATLAADTDMWLWCGLKALDTSGNTKNLVCSQSINYYTSQS